MTRQPQQAQLQQMLSSSSLMQFGAHSQSSPHDATNTYSLNLYLQLLKDYSTQSKIAKQAYQYDKLWDAISGQQICERRAPPYHLYGKSHAQSSNTNFVMNFGNQFPPSNQTQAGTLSRKEQLVQEVNRSLLFMASFPSQNREYNQAVIQLLNYIQEVPSDDNIIFKGSAKAFWQRELGGKYRYKGVKKQGSSYTVSKMLTQVKCSKKSIKNLASAEEAACIYDKLAIKQFGKKAKTNFEYTKAQVLEILNE